MFAAEESEGVRLQIQQDVLPGATRVETFATTINAWWGEYTRFETLVSAPAFPSMDGIHVVHGVASGVNSPIMQEIRDQHRELVAKLREITVC